MAKAPLTAYRIGDTRFPLLDGRGAMLNGGRWNPPGHPVIYGGLSQAGAMLELLAFANIGKLPDSCGLVVINIPGSLKTERLEPESLPGWHHPDKMASQAFGLEWLEEKRSVVLIVPSVIAPHDQNIVINQMHPQFSKITAGETEGVEWDSRLISHLR